MLAKARAQTPPDSEAAGEAALRRPEGLEHSSRRLSPQKEGKRSGKQPGASEDLKSAL